MHKKKLFLSNFYKIFVTKALTKYKKKTEAYVHSWAWYVIVTAVLPICYFISPYFLFIKKKSESEENIKLQQKKKKIKSVDAEYNTAISL